MEEFKEKWANKQKRLTEGLETGIYELHAVVTHLGNSVESGHYMAWVKESEDEWTKYDDDTVYQQPEAKVLQLRGGQPNLEIAYLLMFRKVYTRPLEWYLSCIRCLIGKKSFPPFPPTLHFCSRYVDFPAKIAFFPQLSPCCWQKGVSFLDGLIMMLCRCLKCEEEGEDTQEGINLNTKK